MLTTPSMQSPQRVTSIASSSVPVTEEVESFDIVPLASFGSGTSPEIFQEAIAGNRCYVSQTKSAGKKSAENPHPMRIRPRSRCGRFGHLLSVLILVHTMLPLPLQFYFLSEDYGFGIFTLAFDFWVLVRWLRSLSDHSLVGSYSNVLYCSS